MIEVKIIAHMVVKNEADRFLQACLEWNSQWWDELHVYDDCSTDNTFNICSRYGSVSRRPENVPSFVENEGKFRQAAWKDMNRVSGVTDGDWVFSLDADEFLVGTYRSRNPREALLTLAEMADKCKHDVVPVSVPEVWEHDMKPFVRVDGFWAKNKNERFVRFDSKKIKFKDGMGCGSIPSGKRSPLNKIYVCALLHYGYSVEGAAEERYARYSADPGRHNLKHIESIVQKPELAEWTGEVAKVWLGQK